MACARCDGTGHKPVNVYREVGGSPDYSHTEYRECDRCKEKADA